MRLGARSILAAVKLAIVSDIHGNAVALDAVLDDLRGAAPDAVVCLGDCIQGGPQPAEVVARLRDLRWPVVMGNADAFVLDGGGVETERADESRRVRLHRGRDWTLSQLTSPDVAYMRTFTATVERPLGPFRLLAFHGSPRCYDDIILPLTPDEEVRRLLEPVEGTVYAGGHTHVQFVRHLGRTFHVNPGSVGFAFRHDQSLEPVHYDPWAEYALLTAQGGALGLEFRRVPFDVRRYLEAYRKSGHPYADDAFARYSVLPSR